MCIAPFRYPNVFFCAPEAVQQKCIEKMLAARGIIVSSGQMVDMRLLMTFANRIRRNGYKEKWVEQGSTGAKLCNLSQNARFRKTLNKMVPTLLKISMMWNFEKSKLLLGPEHFVVNGVPLVCGRPEVYMAVDPNVFIDMPYRRAAQMSGNMMLIAVVGTVLGAILFGTSHADVRLGD